MATTGPAVYPGLDQFPGTDQYPGQGDQPFVWVLYSTSDASSTSPVWTDATAKVREFSTSRGRESELQEIDAGTATITLDNRTRTFDPVINTSIRPMNRWWIREQFTGETQDIFKGYAESYDQQWPGGMDAEAVVSCADEFKVLARARLPVMDPPSSSYADLVSFDNPGGYWRFNDVNLTRTLVTEPVPRLVLVRKNLQWFVDEIVTTEKVGFTDWVSETGFAIANETPIVGDLFGSSEDGNGGCLQMGSGQEIRSTPERFDTQGSSLLTVEFWYKFSALPAANRDFFLGATGADLGAGTHRIFWFTLTTAGAVAFSCHDNSNNLTTVTSNVLQTNTWYHVAAAINTDDIRRMFVDGVQHATTAGAGVLRGGGNLDANNPPAILGSTDVTHYLDEVAFYPAKFLSASRLLAHYTAGVSRGFPQQLPGVRAAAVLDAVGSHAPRSLQAGTRTMHPAFMRGQPPLEEVRRSEKTEMPDAIFFAARDGTLTLLAAAHRASAPYDTVQATFDDDGTDHAYLDLKLDYSEAFLVNEWNVTRVGRGGVLQTATDATSVARYGPMPQAVTDVPVTLNSEALAIANALLAKYKDPMTRIQSLTLTTHDPAVTEAVFSLDIGDRIRVFRTPPGGGARIDQTLFVQKIAVDGVNDQAPWRIVLGVSPL